MLDTLESLDSKGPKIRGTIEKIRGDAGIIKDDIGKRYLFLKEVCKGGPDAFPTLKEGMKVIFNEVILSNPRVTDKEGLACNIAIDTTRDTDNLVPKTKAGIHSILDDDDTEKGT